MPNGRLRLRPPQRLTLGKVLQLSQEATEEAKEHIRDYHNNGYIDDDQFHSQMAIIDFVHMKLKDKLQSFDKLIQPKGAYPKIHEARNGL